MSKNTKGTKKKKTDGNQEDFFKQLMGQMGDVTGETVQENDVLRNYYFNEKIDLNFHNNFFISINVAVENIKGVKCIELCKKLGIEERIFIPDLYLNYIVKIPKYIVLDYFTNEKSLLIFKQMNTKAEEGKPYFDSVYKSNNDFTDESLIQIISSKFKKIKKDEKEDISFLDDYIYFKWEQLEKDDVIVAEKFEDRRKSKIHYKIIKTFFEYFNFPIKDFNKFFELICEYTVKTLKTTEEINKMTPKEKEEFIKLEEAYTIKFKEIL